MKLTFTFAILALSLQGLLVAPAGHDVGEQAGSNTLEVDGMMCSDPCYKDATCTATDAALFECKCNGDLVGIELQLAIGHMVQGTYPTFWSSNAGDADDAEEPGQENF